MQIMPSFLWNCSAIVSVKLDALDITMRQSCQSGVANTDNCGRTLKIRTAGSKGAGVINWRNSWILGILIIELSILIFCVQY